MTILYLQKVICFDEEGELVEGVLVEHSCVDRLEWHYATRVEKIKNHSKLIEFLTFQQT